MKAGAFRKQGSSPLLASNSYSSFKAFSIRLMQLHGCFERLHSHIRQTRQPCWRRYLVTQLSRALLWRIFSRHAPTFVLGLRFLPQACPCQKHPSTKTATLAFRHTKSGRPKRRLCLRHPPMPASRSKRISFSSVVRLPLLHTRDISSLRDKPPNRVRCDLALPGHRLILLS